ncbi:hypothetical protein ElyMa_003226100 [Elysia marginata]|uniref:Uncharacterized protein n=1 Tax=Elysia marginata TaxID=1093978 RepID=A0AAV4J7I6_9GAST|nr:hypothetical protein ElyMa_003226100 [Elysia marginata]
MSPLSFNFAPFAQLKAKFVSSTFYFSLLSSPTARKKYQTNHDEIYKAGAAPFLPPPPCSPGVLCNLPSGTSDRRVRSQERTSTSRGETSQQCRRRQSLLCTSNAIALDTLSAVSGGKTLW